MVRTRARVPLLAAILVLAALAGCGDDSSGPGESSASAPSIETVTETSTQAAKPPTETSEAPGGVEEGAPPPADVQVSELTGFTSPTGNIGCIIERRSVRCDIAERDWGPPPKPAGCEVDFGQGIALDAGGAPAFVCAGDTALDSGDPLPYGQSIAAGLLRCESEEVGMTCTDTETGRGFTMAKEAYQIF